MFDPNQIDLCIRRIIDVICHKLKSSISTPKVVWNICVAINKIIITFNRNFVIDRNQKYKDMDYSQVYLQRIFSFDTTQSFLDIFMKGHNYKTKIHACQTLLNYINLNQYGYLDGERNPSNLLCLFWSHIQE